jgi:ribosomal protein S27E
MPASSALANPLGNPVSIAYLRARPFCVARNESGQETQPAGFKSGKDLGEEIRADFMDTVTCVDCGKTEPEDSAYDNGWQIDPVVCPDCLRWVVTATGECCF